MSWKYSDEEKKDLIEKMDNLEPEITDFVELEDP